MDAVPRSVERALTKARIAVASAELGRAQAVELDAPARPVLSELIDEGALDRAVLLLERDGRKGRLAILPRRAKGPPTISEILEEDHRRLDGLAEQMAQLAPSEPVRAVATAHLFADGLRRHFRIEEEVLFPIYCARASARAATDNMRREHVAVSLYLDRLLANAERVVAPNADASTLDSLRQAHVGLSAVLADHNDREERSLFPLLEEPNTDARDDLVRKVLLF
jgi:hemerythrin-like domain-containing protein